MPTLYHCHPVSGELIRQSEARLDPIDGTPMVPAHATLVAPPQPGDAEAVIWRDGVWQLVADHRDTEFWLPDGSHHVIDELGVELPEEALSAPPPPNLDQVKAAAMAQMLGWIEEFTAQFLDGYPRAEIASWPDKAAAARAHLAGQPHQLVLEEAAITGEDPTALAQIIAGHADRYEVIVGRVTGLRRSTRQAIEAATDPAQIPEILAEAQTRASALAAELNITTGGQQNA